MTTEQARLYMQYLPTIISDIMVVLNKERDPIMKADLHASLRDLLPLATEAQKVLGEKGIHEVR